MDKTPLVSILLQSYNHAHYITECIESVFNQTFNDFELIIFDDGSDDDIFSDPGLIGMILNLSN